MVKLLEARLNFNLLVTFLAAVVALCIIGVIVLAALHVEVPDVLKTIAAGGLGALSTAFIKPPAEG